MIYRQKRLKAFCENTKLHSWRQQLASVSASVRPYVKELESTDPSIAL